MSLILRTSSSPSGNLTTASAYASGNAVGGVLTFSTATQAPNYGGIIHTVVLRDKSGNNSAYDLFLFDSAPSVQTNKSAVALTAADLAKCIGVVQFVASTPSIALGAVSTNGLFTVAGLGLAFKIGIGTTIFGVLVTRGTPTYTGTTDVSADLVILPDEA